jgi:hypothetical protein
MYIKMNGLIAADDQPVQVGPPEHAEAAIHDHNIQSHVVDTALQLPPDSEEETTQNDEDSQYWDALTMARLNPASAVSTPLHCSYTPPWLSKPSSCKPRPPSPG